VSVPLVQKAIFAEVGVTARRLSSSPRTCLVDETNLSSFLHREQYGASLVGGRVAPFASDMHSLHDPRDERDYAQTEPPNEGPAKKEEHPKEPICRVLCTRTNRAVGIVRRAGRA
jgi:hypothetical protein